MSKKKNHEMRNEKIVAKHEKTKQSAVTMNIEKWKEGKGLNSWMPILSRELVKEGEDATVCWG